MGAISVFIQLSCVTSCRCKASGVSHAAFHRLLCSLALAGQPGASHTQSHSIDTARLQPALPQCSGRPHRTESPLLTALVTCLFCGTPCGRQSCPWLMKLSALFQSTPCYLWFLPFCQVFSSNLEIISSLVGQSLPVTAHLPDSLSPHRGED